MTGVAAVVFDFDGVLADTERLHLRALQGAVAARGWTLTDEDYFAYYLGFDDRGCVEELGRRLAVPLSDATARALLRDKAARYDALLARGEVLYPGADGCVGLLADRWPLAIASGSLRGEIERILAANGLRDRFQVIVGADDVEQGKPAPDTYARAVEALGVAPATAVAIEDSPWGLLSALDAGLQAVGLTTSYPAEALSGASTIISSLAEFTPDLIAGLSRTPSS